MNRRELLTSVTALVGAALVSEAIAQSGQQITHVDTKTDSPLLHSSVVKMESLQPEGAAPGALQPHKSDMTFMLQQARSLRRKVNK